MDSLLLLLGALSLTIVIECGLALVFRSRQLTYSVLLCNLLTNPLLNLVLLLYRVLSGHPLPFAALVLLELAVVGVEAYIISAMTSFKPKQSFMLSLFFNTASFGIGLLIHW